MKLKNKKTGEIAEADFNAVISGRTNIIIIQKGSEQLEYSSLAELNEEWEDYEEPKEYWYYDTTKNGVDKITHLEDKEKDQEIGNYFETKEEAEQAVEKLKAWKRLKDKGFEFEWVDKNTGSIKFAFFNHEGKITKEMWQDIDLLFGGEE